MRYTALLLTALLTFASCSPPEAPVAAKPPAATKPVLKPAPIAPAPAEPAAQEIMELPTRKAPAPAPPRPAAKAPRTFAPARPDLVYLPAFTFRAIDKAEAVVWMNGQEFSTTPCLWAISEAMDFDPNIPVGDWPPAGAKFIGSTQNPELPNQKAELYLEDRKEALAGIKGLGPNEIVLYVKGKAGTTNLLGALRLQVDGYRYTVYTPLVDPEGDAASKFLRTLWFEGKPKE